MLSFAGLFMRVAPALRAYQIFDRAGARSIDNQHDLTFCGFTLFGIFNDIFRDISRRWIIMTELH